MDYAQVTLPLESREEAQHAVVQQALFQAFNPFADLTETPSSHNKAMVYAVKEGDTLSEIAHRYGISLHTLVEMNRIRNPHMLGIGLKLVLSDDEVKHVVKRGETLNYISARYGVSKELLIERNPLLRWLSDNLYVGQVVYVPIVTQPKLQAEDLQPRKNTTQIASRQATARVRGKLEWPVADATITSGFGVRWGKVHKGVDLWSATEEKTPIQAAQAGVVVEAGANRSGYGRMVVIDHGDGLQTFYAHLRTITVSVGQQVNTGDILGYMGMTGDSTGYHLHFEVRQDDVPINPLPFLNR
ncbi:peptidoglycan DD-metalloendopeptidase family protein [Brevibacillus sp. TJ4]|uniref:peptidoglycan DD-metalloendopeptidase family protein n=1 Tax=Brevibacillus sp. TJ4 TaxID=3234853 RepID=UPI0037D5F9FA